MDTPRRVLVIRPGKEREPVLRALARTSAEIVAADYPDHDLRGLAHRQLPLPRVPAVVRAGHGDELEQRILDFHARYPLTAILADDDYLLPLVGRVNDRLGLRGHTEQSGRACADRQVQRSALDRAGVPQARWAACWTAAQARDFAQTVGGTVVVKPAEPAVTWAAAVAHGEPELEDLTNAAFSGAWNGEILVEERLDGPEFGVEAVVADGVVTTVAVAGRGPGELAGAPEPTIELPARLSEADQAAVSEIAAAAIGACGLRAGLAHVEVRLTPDGPRVVKVLGRAGGVQLVRRVRAVTRLDLYLAWYRVLHGLPVRPQRGARSARHEIRFEPSSAARAAR